MAAGVHVYPENQGSYYDDDTPPPSSNRSTTQTQDLSPAIVLPPLIIPVINAPVIDVIPPVQRIARIPRVEAPAAGHWRGRERGRQAASEKTGEAAADIFSPGHLATPDECNAAGYEPDVGQKFFQLNGCKKVCLLFGLYPALHSPLLGA